ncbi:hypothetical protein C8P68_102725 [Mucilaginibacter yixingensis]|uniref:Uncharacterized protein n=1 Tax=Mucilaginibacter yixingensis TaxID=1295612 RepID=A0A2T5JE16_9SPHI|nr:DUF6358 family protein [Mucilaginibacter yixingensis]PTQ99895.1 hypothetical protein C8P68_102725 [Mucilaginibacter yixingensis]
MWKKFALNIAYTIGFFLAVIIGCWAYKNHQYLYLAGAAVVGIMFVILKTRLRKEVREMLKNR